MAFLMPCSSCKRSHRMEQLPCPTCGVYATPQPASVEVANNCHADYSCDGCQAYREHTNPY